MIRKKVVRLLSYIPFYIMGCDLISNFIDLSEESLYWVYATFNGHSVATNLFMLLVVFIYRFCVATKIAVISINLITLISIFAYSHYWEYVVWYDSIIYGFTILLIAVLFIKKCLNT